MIAVLSYIVKGDPFISDGPLRTGVCPWGWGPGYTGSEGGWAWFLVQHMNNLYLLQSYRHLVS